MATLADIITTREAEWVVEEHIKRVKRCSQFGVRYDQKAMVDWIAEKITVPQLARINKATKQENDPRYLAYLIYYHLIMTAG